MTPGAASDILRTIIAQGGKSTGLDSGACYEALAAAPIGTSIGAWAQNRGNHVWEKTATGWGIRCYKDGPGTRYDSRGGPIAGSGSIAWDVAPLNFGSPGGMLHWHRLALPPDAPTAAPEIMLRRFANHIGRGDVTDTQIAAFLASTP